MIAKTGVQVVRIKTMADNSIRAEIDFGERVKLANFDRLLKTTVTTIILPDNFLSPEIENDINNLIDKINNTLNERL